MHCGLDFGTSNTTLGVVADGAPRLAALEGSHVTLPSAAFFGPGDGVRAGDRAPRIGRAAIAAYLEGEDGRLMRALKSVLGTALIDETTLVGRNRVGFRDVIARFLSAVRHRAEADLGTDLTDVVMGRPVQFVTDDAEANARDKAALGDIARAVGFRNVAFQFEPVAAALEYERSLNQEELALVADIGGGTSDFTVIRLGPDRARREERVADVLANEGVRIGGTDFDSKLSLATIMPLLGYRTPLLRSGLDVPSWYYFDLSTWSRINMLYQPNVIGGLAEVRRQARQPDLIDRLVHVLHEHAGHGLLMVAEQAKIVLSDALTTTMALDLIERGLSETVGRDRFVSATQTLADGIAGRIGDCLTAAGVTADEIDAVFLTGGSTSLPHVRRAILAGVPAARAMDGDRFGAVGLGLGLDARRRFG